MGLDIRPMGKPKPGFEKRFEEIFTMFDKKQVPEPSLWDKIRGRKPIKETLLEEWFSIQTPSYETIKAPRVGRDKEADDWILKRYEQLENKPLLQNFLKQYEDFYVIELAKELDGVPVYISLGQDENVFRGKFLEDCIGLFGEGLIYEAWNSKLALDALDYGQRLMAVADEIAQANGLEFLKTERFPPEYCDEDSMAWQLHIVFSLAKWLIFYGKNGHGYEADW